jgi:hypothetical protein
MNNMKKDKNNQKDDRAVILCEHVAKQGFPILLAIRDEPLEDADSGWQFVCNSSKPEDEDKAQVWTVSEVLEIEPSLADYLDQIPGTILERDNKKSQWKKV